MFLLCWKIAACCHYSSKTYNHTKPENRWNATTWPCRTVQDLQFTTLLKLWELPVWVPLWSDRTGQEPILTLSLAQLNQCRFAQILPPPCLNPLQIQTLHHVLRLGNSWIQIPPPLFESTWDSNSPPCTEAGKWLDSNAPPPLLEFESSSDMPCRFECRRLMKTLVSSCNFQRRGSSSRWTKDRGWRCLLVVGNSFAPRSRGSFVAHEFSALALSAPLPFISLLDRNYCRPQFTERLPPHARITASSDMTSPFEPNSGSLGLSSGGARHLDGQEGFTCVQLMVTAHDINKSRMLKKNTSGNTTPIWEKGHQVQPVQGNLHKSVTNAPVTSDGHSLPEVIQG